MRRRRNSNFPFIFLLFIFAPGLLGGLLEMGFELLFAFLPLIIMFFIIRGMVSTFGGNGNKQKTSAKNTRNNRKQDVKYSNADILKVDDKLRKYFNENITLPVMDDISLVTNNGQYTSLGNLYLTFNGEKITKLSDFKDQYPDMYDKIMELLVIFSKQKDVKKTVEKEIKETVQEVKKTEKLSKASEYINKINELNDAIPHEEITNGLNQTSLLLKQIDLVKGKKDDKKLTKLYDYYLPILVNVLNQYRELNDMPVHGDEFETCENELMKTIILINQALKTICGQMNESEYMNLSADMSTLQSILKKDGLVDDNPFEEVR